jgi:hypothetical protein
MGLLRIKQGCPGIFLHMQKVEEVLTPSKTLRCPSLIYRKENAASILSN